MQMPKGLQSRKLKDELARAGISADLVDIDSLIDSSLSYPENSMSIMSRYQRSDNKARKSTKATRLIGEGGNVDLNYASQYHSGRSEQSRRQDESIRARRTYSEREISRRPGLLDTWFKNPGKSDILNIDAWGYTPKRGSKKRKR